MRGFDFFIACYRKGVDLPIRIFVDKKAPPNLYREYGLCFINLEANEEHNQEQIELLNGFDVYILADSVTDHVRDLTKLIVIVQPRHLVVLAGDTFISWASHRGWS